MNKEDFDYLKKSYIYCASLCSKELFHSNVWGWIFDNTKCWKKFFNAFFERDFCNDEIIEVKREEKHRDLTIYIKDKTSNKYKEAYIIENKLKSIPYPEQLIKYESEIDKQIFKKGVLTGIGNSPEWLENKEFEKWHYVNYVKIGAVIKEIAYFEDANKQYLEDYSETIIKLNNILKEYYGEESKRNLPIYSWKQKDSFLFSELRIWDLAQKYVASEFELYFRHSEEYKELKNRINKINKELEGPNVWFNHGKYCVDIRISNGKKDETYKCIGIQIEGCEYRKFYQHDDFFSKNDGNEKVFNKGKEVGWFMRYDKEKIIEGKQTSQSKEYCSYSALNKNTKKYYSCVYQYWNLNADNSSFEKVKNSVISDLNHAYEIVIENKSLL